MRAVLPWGAALLLLSLAACKSHSKSLEGTVIAHSDVVTLHASEARDLLQMLDAPTRQQAEKDPQVLQHLLRQELGRRALLAEARSRQWDQRPEVAAQMQRAENDVLLNSYLQSVAMPPAGFPSDADLQTAYQLNQQRLMQPRSYHLAQIFITVPADTAGQAAAQARIKKLATQLKESPGRFADLARAESEDKPSAVQGGDLGWVAEPKVMPEIRGAVQGLIKGEVSEPILSAGGWHLLRLIDTRAAGVPPLEQVKPELSAALRQQAAQRSAAAYVEKLVEQQHSAVDQDALQKLNLPPSTTP